MSPRRILLAPAVEPTLVWSALAELGFGPREVFESTEALPVTETVFADASGRVVHDIRNAQLDVRYLELGEDDSPLASQLAARLPHISSERTLERLTSALSTPDRIRALFWVALTAPRDVSSEIVAALSLALADEHVDVRHAAILACAYVGWPTLSLLLEPIATEDPDPTNRADAARLVKTLQAGRPWLATPPA